MSDRCSVVVVDLKEKCGIEVSWWYQWARDRGGGVAGEGEWQEEEGCRTGVKAMTEAWEEEEERICGRQCWEIWEYGSYR